MTPDEMNVRLALLLGYEKRPHEYYWNRQCFVKDGKTHATCDLPKYSSDLNAVAALEATLSRDQRIRHVQNLYKTTDTKWTLDGCLKVIFATATQRTEALIKTLEAK